MHLWAVNLWQTNNVGKIVSSISGDGKTGQQHVKKSKLDHFLPPIQNKLKVD